MKKCAGMYKCCPDRFVAFLMIIAMALMPFVARTAEDIAEMEKSVMGMVDDTAKVNLLLKLGEHYCSEDNDKALLYLQEAYTISLAEDYTAGIGKSLMWQGRVYYYESNFRLAGNYLDKAKKPLEALGDEDALSFWYLAEAFNVRITGDYVKAIKMFNKGIALSKKTGNLKRMATCYWRSV